VQNFFAHIPALNGKPMYPSCRAKESTVTGKMVHWLVIGIVSAMG
jgi:hypothetical protein